MTDVNAVLVAWLAVQMPDVTWADEKPAEIEMTLPFGWVRRGGGGDLDGWLDGPVVNVDLFGTDRDSAVAVAGRLDVTFRVRTPAVSQGVQFTMLRCVQAPLLVPDKNQALRRVASIYSFSLI